MTNRVAVVTGSSSGIGKAIALRFAESGFDVLVHAGRNEKAAAEVANEIRGFGRQAHVIVQDFGDVDVWSNFVQRCWDWQGSVDVWVNNAGADVLTGKAAELDFESKLNRVLQIDVVATLMLSREIGQRMSATFVDDKKRRSIINIGWDQAGQGMAGDSGEMFAASKGAIMACSKSLAQSMAPAVRVNCIAPGWIQTSWGQSANDEWQNTAVNDSLIERWGSPQDVAAVADFLASEAAEFVNGQVINTNGGFRFGSHRKGR